MRRLEKLLVILGIMLFGVLQACDDSSSGGSGGPVCGNGVIEEGEECDSSNLAGRSCEDFGYAGGTLACNQECKLDYGQCESNVGQECDEVGATKCEGDSILTCVTQDGSNVWTETRDCSEDGLVCQEGDDGAQCVEDSSGTGDGTGECTDECSEEGATRCATDTAAVVQCIKGDDGCLHWDVAEQCAYRCTEEDGTPMCTMCDVGDEEDNDLGQNPQSIEEKSHWCFALAQDDRDCMEVEITDSSSIALLLGGQDGSCTDVHVEVYQNGVTRVGEFDLTCDATHEPVPGDPLFALEQGTYQICISSDSEVDGDYLTWWFEPAPRAPEPGDLMITELFWGSEEVGNAIHIAEWVEVLNLTDEYLDLGGCTVDTGSSSSEISEHAYVAPHSYGVIKSASTQSVDGDGTYGQPVMEAGTVTLSLMCGSTTVESMTGELAENVAAQVDSQYVGQPGENDDASHACASVFPYEYPDVANVNPEDMVRFKGTPGSDNHSCTFNELFSEGFESGVDVESLQTRGWSFWGDSWTVEDDALKASADSNAGTDPLVMTEQIDLTGKEWVVFDVKVTVHRGSQMGNQPDELVGEIGVVLPNGAGTVPLYHLKVSSTSSDRTFEFIHEYSYGDGDAAFRLYFKLYKGGSSGSIGFGSDPNSISIDYVKVFSN